MWLRTSSEPYVTDIPAIAVPAGNSRSSPWLLVPSIPGLPPKPYSLPFISPLLLPLSLSVPSSRKPSLTTQGDWLPLFLSCASQQPVPFLASMPRSLSWNDLLLIDEHSIPIQCGEFLESGDGAFCWRLSPQSRLQTWLYENYSRNGLHWFSLNELHSKENFHVVGIHSVKYISVSLLRCQAKEVFLEHLSCTIWYHLTPLYAFSKHSSALTHTDLCKVCLHHQYVSSLTTWFRLLCSLLYLQPQEPCLAWGRHRIKICWMNESVNEWVGYGGKNAQMGLPHTHPDFYFLIISAHLRGQPLVKVKDKFPSSLLSSKCNLRWHQYYFG